jgi:hypothetical protein
MKRIFLLGALGVTANVSYACTICQDVGEYGSSVTQSIAEAGRSITSTTSQIGSNYTSTSSALIQTGENIVGAIIASSNSVTLELAKSDEKHARLMEGFKDSLEQLERSKLIANTNQSVAETYGPENIPRELCEDFSRSVAREEAAALVTELLAENQERQVAERVKEDRTQIVDPFTSTAISISSPTFTEEDSKLAMQQASVITGELAFPESPDVILNRATNSGGGSDTAAQVMSAWIRASNASKEISNQIAKKTVPAIPADDNEEAVSVYGDLWKSIELAANQDANIEDASAGSASLLRSISKRLSVSNRIKLEQLETLMATARINSSVIGFLNERAISQFSQNTGQLRANSAISRQTNASE